MAKKEKYKQWKERAEDYLNKKGWKQSTLMEFLEKCVEHSKHPVKQMKIHEAFLDKVWTVLEDEFNKDYDYTVYQKARAWGLDRHIRPGFYKIYHARINFMLEHLRTPTVSELAKETGYKPGTIRKALWLIRKLELD